MATAQAKHHDYHLVDPSPWPIVGSISAFIMAVGAVIWMHHMVAARARSSSASASSACSTPWLAWWADVIREAEYKGDHTRVVQISHRYGMILFIASEVMFFVAWFWAYLRRRAVSRRCRCNATREALHRRRLAAQGHRDLRSLASAAAQHADPADLGHHRDLGASRAARGRPQGPEVGPDPHRDARRCCSPACRPTNTATPPSPSAGNIYGATFFMATGFHGFHVLVGTIFLIGLPVSGPMPGTSRRPSISASNSPPGTGTSSTWCGCSCSSASMSGAAALEPWPTARTDPPSTVLQGGGLRGRPFRFATTKGKDSMPDATLPTLAQSAMRGLACRCPRCGKGKLYAGFLSLRPAVRVLRARLRLHRHRRRACDFPHHDRRRHCRRIAP